VAGNTKIYGPLWVMSDPCSIITLVVYASVGVKLQKWSKETVLATIRTHLVTRLSETIKLQLPNFKRFLHFSITIFFTSTIFNINYQKMLAWLSNCFLVSFNWLLVRRPLYNNNYEIIPKLILIFNKIKILKPWNTSKYTKSLYWKSKYLLSYLIVLEIQIICFQNDIKVQSSMKYAWSAKSFFSRPQILNVTIHYISDIKVPLIYHKRLVKYVMKI